MYIYKVESRNKDVYEQHPRKGIKGGAEIPNPLSRGQRIYNARILGCRTLMIE